MSQFPLSFFTRVTTLKKFLEIHNGPITYESEEFERFLEDIIVAEFDEGLVRRSQRHSKANLDNICWLRSKNVKQVQKILGKQAYDDLKTKCLFEKFGSMGWIQRTGPCADQLWKHLVKLKDKTGNRNFTNDDVESLLEFGNEELDIEKDDEMDLPFADEECPSSPEDIDVANVLANQFYSDMEVEVQSLLPPELVGGELEDRVSGPLFFSELESKEIPRKESVECGLRKVSNVEVELQSSLEMVSDELENRVLNLPSSSEADGKEIPRKESLGSPSLLCGPSQVPEYSLEENATDNRFENRQVFPDSNVKLSGVQTPLVTGDLSRLSTTTLDEGPSVSVDLRINEEQIRVDQLVEQVIIERTENLLESDGRSGFEFDVQEDAEGVQTTSRKRKHSSTENENSCNRQKVDQNPSLRLGHAGNEGQTRRKKTKRGRRAKKSSINIQAPLATNFVEQKVPHLLGRKWILYSKDLRETVRVSETCQHHFASSDGKELTAKIFGLSDSSELKQLWNIDVQKFLHLMELLIKNEKKFAYRLSLAHHCPVTIPDAPENMACLLKQDSSHNQVYQFLRAVCHRVFPKELLGCAQNWRLFERRMKRIITTGINDRIKVAWFLNNIKAKSCSWLFCTSESREHENRLTLVLHWMVTYLLYVLRAYFYITDTSTHKFMMIFYRKCLWKKIESAAIHDLFSTDKVAEVPQELHEKAVLKMHGTIRFKPKPSTVRSVVVAEQRKNKSDVNSLGAVLQYLQEHYSELRGSSKFDPYEIHEAWREFHASIDKNKKVFAVAVDLKDCFGSINQDLLMDIVHTLHKFEGNIFRVHKFSVMVKAGETIRKHSICKASPKSTSFEEYLLTKCANRYMNNAVFIDQSPEETLYLYLWTHFLHSYITDSVIQVGNKITNLKQGITQGGILSACLCNMYVGVYETGMLGDLGKVPGELMMRTTDDFVFLTQSLERADSFVYQMMNGIPEFNLHPNPAKLVTNFPSNTPGVKVLLEGEHMKWNGMGIDLHNLSVYSDYSQFQNVGIQYTISIDTNFSGTDIKKKLLLHMNLPPLLINPELIGKSAVMVNICKKFHLTARRFHCLVMNCAPNLRNRNQLFLLGIVHQMAVRFFGNSQFAMKKLDLQFSLSMNEVFWLCYSTHEYILRKYASVYPTLLRFLKGKIRCYEIRLHTCKKDFKQIVKASQV